MAVPDILRRRGFLPPAGPGGNLVHLMASLIRSRGGRSPHPGWPELDEDALAKVPRLVLLVVDGLGWWQVEHARRTLGPRAFLDRPARRITTVFPATTAVATTSLVTGASPIEHGILGWFLHLPEIGVNSTILLGLNRLDMPAVPANFPWRSVLRIPSHADTMADPRTLLSYKRIPWSGYSMACGRWDHRRSMSSWKRLEADLEAFAQAPGRGFAYAYWPVYDSACHKQGVFADATLRELDKADQALARVHAGLADRGVGLVVTADHGLLDTRPLDPLRTPGWLETQAVLPVGDARHLACFVRKGREREFLRLTRACFGDRALLVRGPDLAEAGVFGEGAEHPSFRARLGDWFILLKPGWHVDLGLPGADPSKLVGTHGGMSPEEMEVPVFLAGALA